MKSLQYQIQPMLIYIDLDGPILDVSERYYRAHCDILKSLGLGKGIISKEKYWALKRRKAKLKEICPDLTAKTEVLYKNKWLKLIEDKKYLIYDKAWPYAKNELKLLSKRNLLTLVTIRQEKKKLLPELKGFGLYKYFDGILLGGSRNAFNAKAKFILNDKKFKRENAIMIGDTEVDIISAKECKIKTVAVLCGIRNLTFIKKLNPDFIVRNLSSARKLILSGRV